MSDYINKILIEKPITSYLEDRGIFSQKKSGEKLLYCCPIHSGDNDPSFIVYPIGYKEKEYQTYYCFACHSGITLINLKSDLERVSIKESVKFFLKDIDIDNKDVRRSLHEDFKRKKLGIEENRSVELIMLSINSTCRRHIFNECEMDEEETIFFENFFKKVDNIARSRDVESLDKIFDLLVEGNAKRSIEYKKRKEENITTSMNWTM